MTRMLALILLGLITCSAGAAEGVIRVASNHDVETTADRLESILEDNGMRIFQRIDHARGARDNGIELRDTQLLIFGNPAVGGPLMQCQQTIALDLPQKALIWEDAQGEVWIGYNEPAYLGLRHEMTGCDQGLSRIREALAGFAETAAAAQ